MCASIGAVDDRSASTVTRSDQERTGQLQQPIDVVHRCDSNLLHPDSGAPFARYRAQDRSSSSWSTRLKIVRRPRVQVS